MATLVGRAPREFSLDVRAYFTFAIVLASLARHSGPHSYGARREDISENTGLKWERMGPVLNELRDLGLITIKEHQVGTANITDTYYKLIDDCAVEMTLKFVAPGTAK